MVACMACARAGVFVRFRQPCETQGCIRIDVAICCCCVFASFFFFICAWEGGRNGTSRVSVDAFVHGMTVVLDQSVRR